MTDTNGQLSDRQMQALDFTFAEHLIVVGELKNARDQIAELEAARARDQVTIETLKQWAEHNDKRVADAVAVRDRAVEQCAKYEPFLDIIASAIAKMREKPPETLG